MSASGIKHLRDFFGSMAGRIFGLLVIGMIAAALIAALITNAKRSHEFTQQLLEGAAGRLECYIDFLEATPAPARETLLKIGGGGIRPQPGTAHGEGVDIEFQNLLNERGGLIAKAHAQIANPAICFSDKYSPARNDARQIWESERGRKGSENFPPACRLITMSLSDGTPLRFSLYTSPWENEPHRPVDPAFVVFFLLAVGVLAYGVARIASAPLNRLATAATELGHHLDRAPVAVSGPAEVRDAAEAFNAMQQRLQQHVSERTHMLAAITHDLQTPLTRLRLRLERVEDETLRERLVADMTAMSALIDEGLELARSAETSEPRVMLDLDSLLESLVEDANDGGGTATFEQGCQAVLSLRPLAVRRLFSNLIDNAIKYGGCALVSATRAGHEVSVHIRDHGPGLPEDMLKRVFDPFVRLEVSRSRQSGGAGLGLTIAYALAEKNGAALRLVNHPEGGLEAVVRWVLV